MIVQVSSLPLPRVLPHQSVMAAPCTHSVMSFLLVLSFAIVSVSSSRPIVTANGGFSVKMIHRDSPKSPLYNPTETRYQRLANALRRSISRARRFSRVDMVAPADTPEAPMYNNRGEYLMEMSLGTPPFPILAVADTGSDIIWTQCLPCSQCYFQLAPLFDPTKSETYRKVPCSSPRCSFSGRTSCSVGSECRYSIMYGDGSHSNGDIAVETVTLGSTSGRPVSLPETVIGCGHDNGGTFEANVSGIIGLGRGPESLVAQMGSSNGGRFSYCLAPLSSELLDSNTLNFGSNALVSGVGTVSTPIVEGDSNTFYTLTLEAISVGKKRFEIQDRSSTNVNGNIIIDSGTTVTFLPLDFYSNFSTAVSDEIKLVRVKDPNEFLDFCFKTETDNIDAPSITVHFKGADVELSSTNTFIRVTDDVVCLAFLSVENGTPIYGNVAQTNFLIGYDIENMMLSFKPADCAAM